MEKSETTLKAKYTGELHIGNKILGCAVLEDGTRVLTQSGILSALGRSNQPSSVEKTGFGQLPAFLRGKHIEPYISENLRKAIAPLVFKPLHGGRDAYGYKAETLPLVCDVFLDARANGTLPANQLPIAKHCEILVRGLAHVGITALIDEATGYQYERARDALEEILTKFIAKELAQWVKTFDDEYYKELFRLKGLNYTNISNKRPKYFGHYTNDIVYRRLAPGILEELKSKAVSNGKVSKIHHHRWLTRDFGHPKLREHIAAVTALMKASENWDQFKIMLNKVKPVYTNTKQLLLPGVNG